MRANSLSPLPCQNRAATCLAAGRWQIHPGSACERVGLVFAALLLATLFAHSGQAAAVPALQTSQAGLCRTAIAAAEAQTRIPDEFLSAIGRVESGRPVDGAGLTPWPWTINAAGTGHFYATKSEAVAAARGFLASGTKSIDVGCLQVNLMYHPEAFVSLDEAFDPVSNAAFAARLLMSLFEQQRSWPRAAAAYHSETPAIGQAYQQKVLAEWAEPDQHAQPAQRSPTPPLPPARPTVPIVKVPGSAAAAPVAGFARNFRLPGAAAPLPTGRILAVYRAFPVRLALVAPLAPVHAIK